MGFLLTVEQSRRADYLAISAGQSGIDLMARAGYGVAACVQRHYRGELSELRVMVLCGPGNNGGDGFIAAQELVTQGCRVEVGALIARESYCGDALEAARRWRGDVVDLDHDWVKAMLPQSDVIIDALFGSGLSRELDGEIAALVTTINASGVAVVSVDIPSGIGGDDGRVYGVAIRANHTVSFFCARPGHYLLPGRMYCGAVEIVDIGIEASVLEQIAPDYRLNEPDLWREYWPRCSPCDHKYRRGTVLVIGGGVMMAGASRLAAYSALRIGAGLVTLAAPAVAIPIHAAQVTSIVLAVLEAEDDLTILAAIGHDPVGVIGPGGGANRAMRERVGEVLDILRGVVLDADALSCWMDNPEALFVLLRGRADRGFGAAILTPHEGEFMRLFPDLGADYPGGKLARVTEASRRCGAVIVLKGGDSVIGCGDGRAVITADAPASLATAGSGDVLSGLIGGLLAQGMEPFTAAISGVWFHGGLGRLGGEGLIAEDLPGLVPRLLSLMRDGGA